MSIAEQKQLALELIERAKRTGKVQFTPMEWEIINFAVEVYDALKDAKLGIIRKEKE